MKALKVQDVGKVQVQEVPVPKIRPDFILIQVAAAALNPSDARNLHMRPAIGATLGIDVAGTVVDAGPQATTNVKVGDRVAAFVHGNHWSDLEQGAFGEYAIAKSHLLIKIPDWMSFEQGSTLGVAACTIALGVFQKLCINMPNDPTPNPEWVFVNAGSTAMGTFAIQMVKLAGYRVLTTCSPQNFALVQRFGADVAFDYRSPTCAADIIQVTGGKLKYIFDPQSDKGSRKLCSDVASTDPTAGKTIYSGFPLDATEFDLVGSERRLTFAYTVMGDAFETSDFRLKPVPEDVEFSKRTILVVNQLLEDRKIEPHPIDLRSGGLEAIVGGLEDLLQGRVSGKKIVVRIDSRA